MAMRRAFGSPTPASLLPIAALKGPVSGTPAARLLFWNGVLLVALGAVAFACPTAIEDIHPHRRGEENILTAIRNCATMLMGVGALYSFVGVQNFQEYLFGLLMRRLIAVPLLGLCVHFGKISVIELCTFLCVDTAGAIATLVLHRQDLRRACAGKNL